MTTKKKPFYATKEFKTQLLQEAKEQIGKAGYGQHDAGWLGFYDFFRRIGLDVSKLDGLTELAKSSGWFWPFDDVAILTERPITIERDAQNRLHSEKGMALEYPDNWGIYFFHGVKVPEQVIMSPETMTPDQIFTESNQEVKRVMVERYGLEKLISNSKAKILDQDEHRILYEVAVPNDEKIVAVKVNCPSTGNVYFLRVPPDTLKCHEAVAWTFNVPPKEYAPVQET